MGRGRARPGQSSTSRALCPRQPLSASQSTQGRCFSSHPRRRSRPPARPPGNRLSVWVPAEPGCSANTFLSTRKSLIISHSFLETVEDGFEEEEAFGRRPCDDFE